MLPNLIIIGASKCGTTSLHAYLDQHPEIAMARPNDHYGRKEMRYFWRSDWRERRAWYESHFDAGSPIRGEATPAYTHYPQVRGVPSRIKELVPEAKLIYLVRDPIERVLAHWVQKRADGDTRSLEEWLKPGDLRDNALVCPSLYASQLERYLELFSSSQILTLDQRDLRVDRRATLHRVFDFLGVDDSFSAPAFDLELNTSSDKQALTGHGKVLWQRALLPVGRRLPLSLRGAIRAPARRLLSRQVATPSLSVELRDRLRRLLHPEAERLRVLTGLELDRWCV